MFINEPGYHHICLSCPLTGTCFYMAYIVYPISAEGKVIGTISLVAFNDEQKRTLMANNETLLDFIGRMADLIAGNVVEREMVHEKIVIANRLEAVVDSVYEGVMAIDEQGVITNFNLSAEHMFGVKKEQVVGKLVSQMLGDDMFKDALKAGKGFKAREYLVNFQGKKLHFWTTAKPIKTEKEDLAGMVVTFRDFREAQKLAYQIVTTQEMTDFGDIIGQSKAIREVKSKAAKIACSNSTVLIVGERGTGKEIFARAIHTAGNQERKHSCPLTVVPYLSTCWKVSFLAMRKVPSPAPGGVENPANLN